MTHPPERERAENAAASLAQPEESGLVAADGVNEEGATPGLPLETDDEDG